MRSRKRFSPSVYRDILVKQAWRCACCGECFYKDGVSLGFHFDHMLPLSLGGLDEESNLQALIKGHHAKKTHREASARAKTKRIIAQDGLRKKKPSKRDLVYVKVLNK